MEESMPVKSKTLSSFSGQDKHLEWSSQNPLLSTSQFISFCKKRGIKTSAEELRAFRRRRLISPVVIIRKISFYSSFQVYWLDLLQKSFSITFNLASTNIVASTDLVFFNGVQGHGSFSFKGLESFTEKLRKVTRKRGIKELFNLRLKKLQISLEYKKYKHFLDFLLQVQDIYFPYVKSGGNLIQVNGDLEEWLKHKQVFNLTAILDESGLKIGDIGKWYYQLAQRSMEILGVKNHDWMQMWKNIAWSKKTVLEGSIMLGIDYLQWALMLKKIIEDHLNREILDIDEVSNISPESVLTYIPSEMEEYGVLLRASRNQMYTGSDKNYYHDHYKRLFYLANDFGINYQPKVMVFVEGDTEEAILPEVFEKYFSVKPENLGIEFVNFQGISKFFGEALSIKRLDNKYQKKSISNFNQLVSYNLKKWQILPYFIGDNENDIEYLLQHGLVISFDGKQVPLPKDWQYIWGVTNLDKPFHGKDFEMANFSDSEIAVVLSEVLKKEIKESIIAKVRQSGLGISQVEEGAKIDKVFVGRRLIENLFNNYTDSTDRPIFTLLNKVVNLASLNHAPVSTRSEVRNKDYLAKLLIS